MGEAGYSWSSSYPSGDLFSGSTVSMSGSLVYPLDKYGRGNSLPVRCVQAFTLIVNTSSI